jgi:hypothetical protein
LPTTAAGTVVSGFFAQYRLLRRTAQRGVMPVRGLNHSLHRISQGVPRPSSRRYTIMQTKELASCGHRLVAIGSSWRVCANLNPPPPTEAGVEAIASGAVSAIIIFRPWRNGGSFAQPPSRPMSGSTKNVPKYAKRTLHAPPLMPDKRTR